LADLNKHVFALQTMAGQLEPDSAAYMKSFIAFKLRTFSDI
jgi:hypothetical protein